MFSISAEYSTSYITITKRIYTNDSISAFREELKNYRWDLELINIESVDDFFNSYMDKFGTLYDKNFPLKSFSVKEKHFGKPYITPGIIKSIKQRNRLQKLYAKWPLTYETKSYRNTLTAVIRTAKENYFKSKSTQQLGDVKKKNMENS